MTRDRLDELLEKIRSVRIGVVGDFCLDVYWQLDPGTPEHSFETGLPTLAVRTQRSSAGGAGNVAANLAALGAGSVRAFGVIGPDLFGRELVRVLRCAGIDAEGMLMQESGWDTSVYAKPYLAQEEQERIDFGRWNGMAPETESALIGAVRTALASLHALVVNQQLPQGVMTGTVIRALGEMARERRDLPFLLDARSLGESLPGMYCKVNAAEAARLAGMTQVEGEVPDERLRTCARAIAGRTGRGVFITRGARGLLLFDGAEFTDIPALRLASPLDTVGAGDTTVSAIAASLAAGASLPEAGELGTLASAVTVRKLRETGTATAEEVKQIASTRLRRVSQ